jgi:DNA-3-methyladenine glycosylase II
MTTHQLSAAQPFDFAQSLGFLERFAPLHGEQTIAAGRLHKAFAVEDRCAVCDVEAADDGVAVSVHGAHEDAACARIRRFLCLDQALAPFLALAANDPLIADVARRAHGFHHVEFPTPFECACWGVLNQRVARPVAKGWKRRITERFGPATIHEGATFRGATYGVVGAGGDEP